MFAYSDLRCSASSHLFLRNTKFFLRFHNGSSSFRRFFFASFFDFQNHVNFRIFLPSLVALCPRGPGTFCIVMAAHWNYFQFAVQQQQFFAKTADSFQHGWTLPQSSLHLDFSQQHFADSAAFSCGPALGQFDWHSAPAQAPSAPWPTSRPSGTDLLFLQSVQSSNAVDAGQPAFALKSPADLDNELAELRSRISWLESQSVQIPVASNVVAVRPAQTQLICSEPVVLLSPLFCHHVPVPKPRRRHRYRIHRNKASKLVPSRPLCSGHVPVESMDSSSFSSPSPFDFLSLSLSSLLEKFFRRPTALLRLSTICYAGIFCSLRLYYFRSTAPPPSGTWNGPRIQSIFSSDRRDLFPFCGPGEKACASS